MTNSSHLEILNLNARFVEAVDHDPTLDRVLTYFAPDGVWEMAGGEFRGHEEIRGALQRTRDRGFAGPDVGTSHVVSSHRVDVSEDGATATGSSQWLLMQSATPPESPSVRAFGRYEDEYAAIGGSWVIVRRRVIS